MKAIPGWPYVHSKVYYRPGSKTPLYGAAPFKPLGRKPVKGGRIQIRKRTDGRWRVWSNGRSHKHSRTFKTWREAYDWGCVILNVYYTYRYSNDANMVLKAIRMGRNIDNGGW